MNLFNKKPLTEDEQKMKDLVDRIISAEKTKFQHSPINHEIIVLNREKQIFLLIEDDGITVSNHDFTYKRQFRLNFISQIKSIVNQRIEQERQELKKELFKNEMQLLDKIHNLFIT